jgi:hypothetical protein
MDADSFAEWFLAVSCAGYVWQVPTALLSQACAPWVAPIGTPSPLLLLDGYAALVMTW